MPIDSKIGKRGRDSDIMSRAKGKSGASFANTFFGTVEDMFYEFGVVGRVPQKAEDEKKEEE